MRAVAVGRGEMETALLMMAARTLQRLLHGWRGRRRESHEGEERGSEEEGGIVTHLHPL